MKKQTEKKKRKTGRIPETLKHIGPQIACVLAGFILYILAVKFQDQDLINGNTLKRNSYGQSSTNYELYINGLTDNSVKLEIPVASRRYSDEDVGEAFDTCMDYLLTVIIGKNASLDEISSNMVFPEKISEFGMSAEWASSDPELVTYSGEVKNAGLESDRQLVLKTLLTDGTHEALYEIPIRVIPEILTPDEKSVTDFLETVKSMDQGQITQDTLTLPSEYMGHSVSYSQNTLANYNMFWMLGIALAILLWLRQRINQKNAGEAKLRQMLLDYPEIVSKMMVFLGAGMTARLAWANIVGDYEKDAGQTHYAYEEMSKAYYQLKSGVNEGRVYREFGRNCGLKQYMKFASLLEQNRRTGVGNLRNLLSLENVEAWEERKNIARRLGEEAATKLLLPLFIMLAVVMAMITVPALMSFI